MCIEKPSKLPSNPRFSSGPCTKRKGWSLKKISQKFLGRYHRSQLIKARLKLVVELTRVLLKVPEAYRILIVPGSGTGAMEVALWSFLGEREIDLLVWEKFGYEWLNDIQNQLKLSNLNVYAAPYGMFPDTSKINPKHDLVFVWNGTTSGVCIPNLNFIPKERYGLTICDATSSIFTQPIAFEKLDVVSFSWQKALGGEASNGMLILSPCAVKRLETYNPAWPIPRLFRLRENNKIKKNVLEGDVINTPSLMCIEDYLDSLNWALSLGGVEALQKRVETKFLYLDQFLKKNIWLNYLAKDSSYRSHLSVCLKVVDPSIVKQGKGFETKFITNIVRRLEHEQAAFDILSHKDAPIGFRIWLGPTVEYDDLKKMLPWLKWAYEIEKMALKK